MNGQIVLLLELLMNTPVYQKLSIVVLETRLWGPLTLAYENFVIGL